MEELYSSQCIYYSLNKNFAMYVQCKVVFTEPIDIAVMNHALDTTMSRYPYFKVKLVRVGERYRLEDNDAPFLLYDDPDSPTLEPEKNNGYLIRVCASGCKLTVCFCHALADGRGILPFVKTLFHYYYIYRYGSDSGMTDVNLAGEKIPEEECIDPYLAFDASSIKIPAQSPEQKPVFLLPDKKDPEGRFFIHSFAVSCDKFMKFAHSVDGSPNSLFVLFYYRMLLKLFPEHAEDIVLSVAVDLRKALGVTRSHHSTVSIIPMRYDTRMSSMSTDRCDTVIRGRIIVGSDDDNLRTQIAQSKMFADYVRGLGTLKEKIDVCSSVVVRSMMGFTATVSYPRQQDYGKMNEYIQSFHIIANNPCATLGIELASCGPWFFVSVLQGYDNDKYAAELRHQMELEGIECVNYRKEIIPNVRFMDLM